MDLGFPKAGGKSESGLSKKRTIAVEGREHVEPNHWGNRLKGLHKNINLNSTYFKKTSKSVKPRKMDRRGPKPGEKSL